MLGSRQQTWTVVDIGGRWIKCARYEIRAGHVQQSGFQVIDIQSEGLLTAEEVGVAIGRALRSGGEHPLAVVLPQSTAVSQVVDLPELSGVDHSGVLGSEIFERIGLSTERCVYDRHPLKPFGAYVSPQWVTVAKEEQLIRHLSPLLAQGLRVEAVTTGGNALVAAFRQAHPGVSETFLVDVGATQTTIVQLWRGEPVQMTSLAGGGENWTEALLELSGDAFEEVEARLARDDLFVDPLLGPVFRTTVGAWRDRVLRQIDEWREELGSVEEKDSGSGEIYLFGGYSATRGLGAALAESGGASWQMPAVSDQAPAPVWMPAEGVALMAAGYSRLKASILPRSLAKMRERRRALSRLESSVLYLFVLVAIILAGVIFKQQDRQDALVAANRQAKETLAEIETSAGLLERRDHLAAQIEPIVRGQLNSLAVLETFRRIQRAHRDFDFTLLRFADRRTYFEGMNGSHDETAEAAVAGLAAGAPKQRASSRPAAFVMELTVRGGQAERLQVLSDIVGRLRQEKYFANVDRLVGGPDFTAEANGPVKEDQAYALLLILAEELLPAAGGEVKGAAR